MTWLDGEAFEVCRVGEIKRIGDFTVRLDQVILLETSDVTGACIVTLKNSKHPLVVSPDTYAKLKNTLKYQVRKRG
jgi:hypothetical protein